MTNVQVRCRLVLMVSLCTVLLCNRLGATCTHVGCQSTDLKITLAGRAVLVLGV